MKSKLISITPLATILLLGFTVRTYRFHRPLADWHSWRQADTAAVTRRYVNQGIDLLHPKYDDLSNIPSGLENPEGYRMVEFPFVNAFIAYTYNLTSSLHYWPVHVFSRLINILFYTFSALYLYLISKQLIDTKTALIITAIYQFLPFGIFYSTTTLPEIPLLFFALASIYYFIQFCHHDSTRSGSTLHSYSILLLFTLTSTFAFLLKPTFIFFGLPLTYYYLKHHGINKKLWLPTLTLTLALTPLVLWRRWISQFPEGIPAYQWLMNGNGIRFRPAFFRWLFADRLGRLILGYWGPIPFFLGIIAKPHKRAGWFFHWWLLSMLAYLTIFATGNVTHDYYQIILLPIIAIFVGLGISSTLKLPSSHFNRLITYCLLLIACAFALAFSWFHVRDYFNINNPAIVAAGLAADKLTPPDSKIIAPYMGDTALLYQTNRQGWPIGGLIQQRISQGATHYLTTTYDDEARDLASRCTVLDQTDQYTLIDLTTCTFE